MATPRSDPTAATSYGPAQTALILLDFHSLFVPYTASATSALHVASSLRQWAKSQNIQVIHCPIDINSTPFPTCKDIDRFSKTNGAMKTKDGEEPRELVKKMGDDVTFARSSAHVSALRSPGLQEFLEEKGIKSLW